MQLENHTIMILEKYCFLCLDDRNTIIGRNIPYLTW